MGKLIPGLPTDVFKKVDDLIAEVRPVLGRVDATLVDVERTLVSGWIGDELGDMSYRELIRQYTGDFTEADWRMEYEDHNEYMNDAHDEA